MEIKLSNIIAKPFYGLHNSIAKFEYPEYMLKGGRGSTKSSFIATEVVLGIMSNNRMCAAVFMKHGVRLRFGAFNLYNSVIHRLGVANYFKISLSPMQITYKPTGQCIVFRGLDDPYKTKGISTSKPEHYFGYIHFEEVDQFFGTDELQTTIESVIRGGDEATIFYCFNPPKNKFNWCNQWSEEDLPERYVHYSNYTDIPADWLGRAFIEKAERLKEYDYKAYENRYLGIPNGGDGAVFNNVEYRTISNKEIENFDYIFQGFDWGWFPDPAVFVRLYYDIKNTTIYIIDEIVDNKKTVEQYAEQIIKKGYNDHLITIDGAIPEQEYRFRMAGLNAMSVVKGPGSIELGLTWLENKKFVIDEARTPFTCKEIREYEYETDKNGCYTGRYMEFNNHSIDAIRYSLLDYIRRYNS